MPKRYNLTGQKFGKLEVLCDTGIRKNKEIVWKCKCDCGKIHEVRTGNLVTGKTKSCGCLKHQDLKNKTFGNLFVICGSTKKHKNRYKLWKCKCDCGKIVLVTSRYLTSLVSSGYTKSCGCKRKTLVKPYYKKLQKQLLADPTYDGEIDLLLIGGCSKEIDEFELEYTES